MLQFECDCIEIIRKLLQKRVHFLVKKFNVKEVGCQKVKYNKFKVEQLSTIVDNLYSKELRSKQLIQKEH